MHVPAVTVTLGIVRSRNWTTASEEAFVCAIDILIRPLLVTWLTGSYKCGPHEQRCFRLWTSHDTLRFCTALGSPKLCEPALTDRAERRPNPPPLTTKAGRTGRTDTVLAPEGRSRHGR